MASTTLTSITETDADLLDASVRAAPLPPAAESPKEDEHDDLEQRQDTDTNDEVLLNGLCLVKFLILTVLLAAVSIAAYLVYTNLERNQQEEFESAFDNVAEQLRAGVHANTLLRLQMMDVFSLSLTSIAMATNQTWPFVTLPDFEAKATAVRVVCQSDFLELYNYVNDDTRDEWEAFTESPENIQWLQDSYDYQREFQHMHNRTVGPRGPFHETDDGQTRALRELIELDIINEIVPETDDDEENNSSPQNVTFDGPFGISTQMFRYGTEEEGLQFVVEDGPGPYWPMWQQSPVREYASYDINYNTYDAYWPSTWSAALEVARINRTAIFGAVWNVDDDGVIDDNDDYDFRVVPTATLFYPVFETIAGSGHNVPVVSVIGLDMQFGSFFSSILASDSNAIFCVVSNPCGQTFTYKVTGVAPVYLGPEDLHDPDFDDWKREFLLTDLESQNPGMYNGAPVYDAFCPWKIEIYASNELQDEHISNAPLACTMVVVALFLLMCGGFSFYDYVHGQKDSMNSNASYRY